MKKLLLATLPALLIGCQPAANMPTVTVDGATNMQSSVLKDCNIIYVVGDTTTRPDLWVVRCPNSDVSTQYHVKSGNISTTIVGGSSSE